MDFTNSNVRKYFGSNYEKTKKNYKDELTRAKTDFVTKYPYSKIYEFEFWVNIDRDGTISRTTIVYKKDGNTKLYNETGTMWKYSWAISSKVFKNLYVDALHRGHNGLWEPIKGSLTLTLGNSAWLPFDVTKFPVAVSETQSFQSITLIR